MSSGPPFIDDADGSIVGEAGRRRLDDAEAGGSEAGVTDKWLVSAKLGNPRCRSR
jgi:hypothetical protein